MTAHDTQETPMTLEQTLAEHEPFGCGSFCVCSPVDEDGCRQVLATDWETHLADVIRAWLVGLLDTPQLREQVADVVRPRGFGSCCFNMGSDLCRCEQGRLDWAERTLNVVRDAIGGRQ